MVNINYAGTKFGRETNKNDKLFNGYAEKQLCGILVWIEQIC